MTNKGIITATIIGSGAYLAGKFLSAKAAEKRTKEMSSSIDGLYDKLFTWCDKYMSALGVDMTK